MITIDKETPQMFMWFTDGLKLPNGVSPLPQNARLDYIQRLKEECAKLLRTKTPVYLVYMGRLLNKEQITLLENLQKQIPNLAVIDYDEVEKNIAVTDSLSSIIIDKMAAVARSYQLQEKLNTGIGGIATLVDLGRLVLLYHSKILREIAQKKIESNLEWRNGLIYRDFDVTLEKEEMPDIPTTHGYMATLNFLQSVNSHYNHLIKLATINRRPTQKITRFFETYIYDLERYQQILSLFVNPGEEKAKQDFLREYQEIGQKKDDFEWRLILDIQIENSFLAVNQDQHQLIRAILEETCKPNGDDPYGQVQKYFRSEFPKRSYMNEYLTPQLIGFNIGNDLTWKMSIKQQHQLEAPNSHLLSIEVYIQDNLGAEILALPAQKSIEQQHQPETLNSSLFSNEIYIQQEQQEEVDAEVLALPVDSSEKQPHAVKNNKNERKKQEVIDKLTTLTKKYLTHLNTTSRKNNDNLIQSKHTIISKLDNILSDTSLERNEKLHLFSAHFQTADKELLKNHREPNWVAFKKVALFFLSLTGIGAIFGVIDYGIRRHHSIFCTPKSHGERFVLDIENIWNP